MAMYDMLIATIPHRHEKLCGLLAELGRQMMPGAGVRVCRDNLESPVGVKRQALVESSRARYISFIDDDDRVAPDFIPRMLAAMETGCDYVGFELSLLVPVRKVRVTLQVSGGRPGYPPVPWPAPGEPLLTSGAEADDLIAAGVAEPWPGGSTVWTERGHEYHSLRYHGWVSSGAGGDGQRDIMHLNPVRRELALAVPFEGGWCEDERWADGMRAAGRVRTETYIGETMYFYRYDARDGSRTAREPLPAHLIEPLPCYPWLTAVAA